MGEKVEVVAWQMSFADGRKAVLDNPMDPREVHDNGRPYYALMTVAQHDRIVAGLEADARRLNFLDELNRRLNARYQTDYGWRLILSPNIVRLMSGVQARGFVGDIDLNDADGSNARSKSCRDAIDAFLAQTAEGVA